MAPYTHYITIWGFTEPEAHYPVLGTEGSHLSKHLRIMLKILRDPHYGSLFIFLQIYRFILILANLYYPAPMVLLQRSFYFLLGIFNFNFDVAILICYSWWGINIFVLVALSTIPDPTSSKKELETIVASLILSHILEQTGHKTDITNFIPSAWFFPG